jgi:hypothetical protein
MVGFRLRPMQHSGKHTFMLNIFTKLNKIQLVAEKSFHYNGHKFLIPNYNSTNRLVRMEYIPIHTSTTPIVLNIPCIEVYLNSLRDSWQRKQNMLRMRLKELQVVHYTHSISLRDIYMSENASNKTYLSILKKCRISNRTVGVIRLVYFKCT